PYRIINFEYGKGLYIYHSGSPYTTWPPNIDLECADGLYNWQTNGTFYPDWVNPQSQDPQTLPILVKTSISYDNDISTNSNVYSNRDDKSVDGLNGNWGSVGKLHQSLHGDGTNRLYTNDEDIYTSRAGKGDRFDAWRVGYNEVFSPYSSPSTNTWNNEYSGVFIWLYGESGNTASLKIYKDDELTGGTTDLDEILEATPPSRPMGLKVQEYNNGEECFPKLTWNHNMEPDMRVLVGSGEQSSYQKRYKIFRATYPSIYGTSFVYSEIDDIYINENLTPEYIDTDIHLYYCSVGDPGPNYHPYPVRYMIKAVDEHLDQSVYSDFVSTLGSEENGGPIDPDRPMGLENENDLPNSFSLQQNYPNPFNPTTNIQYDIPKDVFVSIKVYDMLGREIAELVNEVKNAGRYIVGFNGSNLASGIYYYKIKAGNFEQTRRMVLVK
ncbi:MAG TPA: T9SS type A sorting domain-containing protein, partial [Ignavibacteria bacterium]|nr:T9SS type A sorting domain-containing protein [Ignavibacteria bacterium]